MTSPHERADELHRGTTNFSLVSSGRPIASCLRVHHAMTAAASAQAMSPLRSRLDRGCRLDCTVQSSAPQSVAAVCGAICSGNPLRNHLVGVTRTVGSSRPVSSSCTPRFRWRKKDRPGGRRRDPSLRLPVGLAGTRTFQRGYASDTHAAAIALTDHDSRAGVT